MTPPSNADIAKSLSDPIAMMGIARTLRRSADVLEKKVIEATNWRFEQLQLGEDSEELSEVLEAPSREERELALNYDADEKMSRVAQMLFQMSYENAAKAIIKLKGNEPPKIHNLERLFKCAGIVLPEDIDAKHLPLLSQMNQLGRFTLTADNDFKTFWSTQYRERRAAIDAAIEKTWLTNHGAIRMADVTEIDDV